LTCDDGEYVLQFSGDQLIQVPRSAFATPQDEDRFRELVDQHLPGFAPVAG
jgi:hypothetical protein